MGSVIIKKHSALNSFVLIFCSYSRFSDITDIGIAELWLFRMKQFLKIILISIMLHIKNGLPQHSNICCKLRLSKLEIISQLFMDY